MDDETKLRARVAELEAELAATRLLGLYCAQRAFPTKSAPIVVPTRRADCDARAACFGIDPARSFAEVPYVSIDVETTGVEPTTDRVIEIAFVTNEGREWSSLVNPGVPIPAGASAVHGIDDAAVVGAPTFAEAWAHAVDQGFIEVGQALPLAYSAPFDQSMICAELARAGFAMEAQALADAEWIDPLVIVKDVDKYQKGKKLVDACARRGITLDGAHRALADARAAHALFQHIVPHDWLEASALKTLRRQRDMRAAQEADFKAWQERQGKGRAA